MSEKGTLEMIVMRYPVDGQVHRSLVGGARAETLGYYWRAVGHCLSEDGASASWRLVPDEPVTVH